MAAEQVQQAQKGKGAHWWRPSGLGEWASRFYVPACGAPERRHVDTFDRSQQVPPQERCPDCVQVLNLLRESEGLAPIG